MLGGRPGGGNVARHGGPYHRRMMWGSWQLARSARGPTTRWPRTGDPQADAAPEKVIEDKRRKLEQEHGARGAGARAAIFQDRLDAGQRLAEALKEHAGPDGGARDPSGRRDIVGEVVAGMLGVPIDVVVPRKVGAPGNPELGLGAVAPGVRVLDPWLIERLGVSEDYLEREIAAEEAETVRRLQAYRGTGPRSTSRGRPRSWSTTAW